MEKVLTGRKIQRRGDYSQDTEELDRGRNCSHFWLGCYIQPHTKSCTGVDFIIQEIREGDKATDMRKFDRSSSPSSLLSPTAPPPVTYCSYSVWPPTS